MRQNSLAAGLRLDPLGELHRFSRPPVDFGEAGVKGKGS